MDNKNNTPPNNKSTYTVEKSEPTRSANMKKIANIPDKPLNVIISGGGTAGHINPALAIADKLKAENPKTQILFVGAKGRMETRLVPAVGYDIKTIDVRGFQRKVSLKNIGRNIAAAYRAVASGSECSAILKEFKPDVVVGTGGYVSGPLLRKAAQAGIPTLVHESNAFPGMAVKMLAKHVDVIMISSDKARKYLPDPDADESLKLRIVKTGNPLRKGFTTLDKRKARKELDVDSRPLIVSYGGSLGADRINEVMTQIMIKSGTEKNFQHIHATGSIESYERARVQLDIADACKKAIVLEKYIDNMPTCMAAADIVISRSGAMTISELAATGKPSVLIPSPYVAENHQFYNAMVLVDAGGAICIEEKDLTVAKLWNTLLELTESKAKLGEMGEKAKKVAIFDAEDKIYRTIIKTIYEKREKNKKI